MTEHCLLERDRGDGVRANEHYLLEHIKTSNSDKQKAKTPTVSEGTSPYERGRRSSKRPCMITLPRKALQTCISPESVALPRNR